MPFFIKGREMETRRFFIVCPVCGDDFIMETNTLPVATDCPHCGASVPVTGDKDVTR